MSDQTTPVIPQSASRHVPAPYSHKAFTALIDTLTAVHRMCAVLGMNPHGSADERDRAGIAEFCRSAADRLTVDRAACVALGGAILKHSVATAHSTGHSTEQQLFELGALARSVAEKSVAHTAQFLTELDMAARPEQGPKWRTCSNCHALNAPDTEHCESCQEFLPDDDHNEMDSPDV